MMVSRMPPPVEELSSYRESLLDLNCNSKPHINMLTMLAEENFSQGSAVVKAIGDHIRQVPPAQKLPSLYLIDSILKNVTQVDFKPLFRPHLIQIFAHIFEKSDENTKKAMYKLRQTWDVVFDDKFMAELDRAVNKIDNNWPCSPLPAPAVALPPVFTNGVAQEKDGARTTSATVTPFVAASPPLPGLVEQNVSKVNVLRVKVPVDDSESALTKAGDVEPENGRFRSVENLAAQIAEKPIPVPDNVTRKLPRIPRKPAALRAPLQPPQATRFPVNRPKPVAPVHPVRQEPATRPRFINPAKRTVDQSGVADRNPNIPVRKIPKTEEFRPDHREPVRSEHREPLLPEPVAVPQRMRGQARFTHRGGRVMERPGRPYIRHAHPRQVYVPEQRWPGPPIHNDRPLNSGRYPTEMEMYSPEMPLPRAPRMPTPDSGPVAAYKKKEIEARERLQNGDINSEMFDRIIVTLKRDLDLQKLRMAVDRSIPRKGLDGRLFYTPFEKEADFVYIDESQKEVLWVNSQPVVIVNGDIFDIGFSGPPVDVFIDHIRTELPMNAMRSVYFGNRFHNIKFGGPNYELVIDENAYRMAFEGPEARVIIDEQEHRVRLGGPPPQVSIGSDRRNEEIFAKFTVKSDVEPSADDQMLKRILESEIFAQITATVATPVVAAPEAVVVPPPPRTFPGRSRSDSNIRPEQRSTISNGNSSLEDFFKIQTPEETKMLKDGEEYIFMDFEKAKLAGFVNNLYRPLWEKLNLKRDFSCRLCEQRFLPDEHLLRRNDILFHNGWIQKNQVHTGDWLLTSDEFINEKSFAVDTSEEDIIKTFTTFVAVNRPMKAAAEAAALVAAEASENNLKAEPEQTEESLEENPIVGGQQKRLCFLCREEIPEILNDEDDEWVLKDAVRITNNTDGSVKIFHRDCYEESKKKPTSAEPVLLKPSRWGAAAIDDEALVDNVSSVFHVPSQTVIQRMDSSETNSVDSSDNLPASFESGLIITTSKTSAQDDFVINFGDDDDDDDDEFGLPGTFDDRN